MSADKTLIHLAELAYSRQKFVKDYPFRYFVRSFIAGMFVSIGTIFSSCAGANLFPIDPGIARVTNGITMSIALILVTFIGGELFTGINFLMAIGLYTKKCSFIGTLKVWLICWLGNLVASILLGLIFVASDASSEVLRYYYTAVTPAKLELNSFSLLIRGVFANFCVCSGVLASFKMRSEIGKIMVIIFCVSAFIISAFEHCIANMSMFVIAFFYAEGFQVLPALNNIAFSTLGNIIGGAVILGFPFYYISKETTG